MSTPTRLGISNSRTAVPSGSARMSRASWELQPDDPITPIPNGTFGRLMRRFAWFVVVGMAGAWAAWGDVAGWRDWLVAEAGPILSRVASLRQPGTKPEPAPALAQSLQPETPLLAPAAPPAETQTAAPVPTADQTVVLNAPAEPAVKPAPLPAAPSVGTAYATPSRDVDPLERRATAAGLHPEISRALLMRLSAADFDNARRAIEKAIAETPGDATLVWPRQRKPELALFHVHFVPGAAPDCRRYVVTITKDSWMTTALPMERCGVKQPPARKS